VLNRMKRLILLLFAFAVISGQAQMGPQNISSAQLQVLLDLPLDQAIQRRNTYKGPLKAAYARQIALIGKDCQTEMAQGQQPYNICMGQADEEADRDYATFYNNLQWLCHDGEQLKTLQSSQTAWKAYQESAMNAASAAWSSGTGAPGFAGEVYLTLLRDNMRELHKIYGLNISQ
jgi:uncharacterized protein YecT (DUF1311 family)